MDNQKLHPFVCGLCNHSYDQFVSFYKHFKNHIKEVGQDSFHICEDLPSSERDMCEDQSESLEMPTFNCGICPASFIKVCMLHEHMEKHESKGSYTLDMQSKTGYPSPQQYPYVRLSNYDTSRCMDIHSEKVVAIKSEPDDTLYDVSARNRCNKSQDDIKVFVENAEDDILEIDNDMEMEEDCDIDMNDDDNNADILYDDSNDAIEKSSKLNDDVASNLDFDDEEKKNDIAVNSLIDEDNSLREPENGKRPTIYSFRIKKSSHPHIKSTSSLITSDQGKSLICEVCGINKVKHMLVKHVEEKHGHVKLSDGFLELLEELKMKNDQLKNADYVPGKTSQHRKQAKYVKQINVDHAYYAHGKATKQRKRGKSGKTNVKDMLAEDEDFSFGKKSDDERRVKCSIKGENTQHQVADKDPEVDLNRSPPLMLKDLSQNHVILKIAGKDKKYAECIYCGIVLRYELIRRHEEAHCRHWGKLKYAPENMTKCEQCGWVMMKKDSQGHSCEKVIIEERIEPGEGMEPVDHVNKFKGKRVMLKIAGKWYVECIHCGIAVRCDTCENHEKYHSTRSWKRKYAPENLAKCKEECGLILFKKWMHWHKCSSNVVQERSEPEEGHLKTPCDICGVLIELHKIGEHRLTHADVGPFSCMTCAKTFKTKDLFLRHDEIVHPGKLYRCDKCPEEFPTSSRLNYHYRIKHDTERVFTCTACGFQFKFESKLKRHMEVHDDQTFACEECPKVFNTRQTYLCHMKAVHRKDQHWICSWEGCGKRFPRGAHLRRHMLKHTGEKPAKCNLCDAAYSVRETLRKHMLLKHHTGEMPEKPPLAPKILYTAGPTAATGEGPCPPDSSNTLLTVAFPSTTSITKTKSKSEGKSKSEAKPVLNVNDSKSEQGTSGRKSANKPSCRITRDFGGKKPTCRIIRNFGVKVEEGELKDDEEENEEEMEDEGEEYQEEEEEEMEDEGEDFQEEEFQDVNDDGEEYQKGEDQQKEEIKEAATQETNSDPWLNADQYEQKDLGPQARDCVTAICYSSNKGVSVVKINKDELRTSAGTTNTASM